MRGWNGVGGVRKGARVMRVRRGCGSGLTAASGGARAAGLPAAAVNRKSGKSEEEGALLLYSVRQQRGEGGTQ